MNLNEMVQDPGFLHFQQEDVDDLNRQPPQEQIKTPRFDLFFELDMASELVTEWERFHFGSNDRMRQTIMYYLAFENRFAFVDKNGFLCAQLEPKRRRNYMFFQIQLKNEYTSESIWKLTLQNFGIDYSEPGRRIMWLGGPHIRLIRIFYQWMTEDGLRLLDFETQGKRVLKISEKI